jgi:hypothetical protein
MTLGEIVPLRPGRKAIVLLGMHRSGTSLLASLLHGVGAALPTDVIGPGRGNLLGHWEPRNLVEINDDVFRALNRRWDDVRAIDTAWFHSEGAADFIDRIRLQIRSDYGESELLLIKDPRICRLLPLYLTALHALDIETLVILQLRPVGQVIESLARRDGLEPEISALLWARSILEAERYSRDCRRIWVTFENILAHRGRVLDDIAARCGISWPTPYKSADLESDRIAEARDRDTQAESRTGMTQWLLPLVWSAAEQAMSGDVHAAEGKFDTLWLALGDMDRMYTTCFNKLYDASDTMLDAIIHSTSWRITAPLRAMRRFGLWAAPLRRQVMPIHSDPDA